MSELNPYPRVWRDGKVVRQHRATTEEALGRKLEAQEVVHHVNGDKTDNRLENLRVLPSQRHHMVLEHYERREGRGLQHLFDLNTWLECVREM